VDRLELYKSIYEKEEEKRFKLNDSLNLPFGIISLLVTIAFTITLQIEFQSINLISISFIFVVVILTFFLLKSIYYFYKAFEGFKGYEYDYIPTPEEFETSYQDLSQFYTNEDERSKIFKEEIIKNYISSTTYNLKLNQTKSADITKGKINLAGSLLTTLVLAIIYLINKFN